MWNRHCDQNQKKGVVLSCNPHLGPGPKKGGVVQTKFKIILVNVLPKPPQWPLVSFGVQATTCVFLGVIVYNKL